MKIECHLYNIGSEFLLKIIEKIKIDKLSNVGDRPVSIVVGLWEAAMIYDCEPVCLS